MKHYALSAFILLFSASAFSIEKPAPQVVEIQVTENGFEPNEIEVKSDSPVTLRVTRKTDATCATEIQLKEKKVKKDLPLNETVSIDLGNLKKGNHGFSCGMNMLSGKIKVK